MLGVGFGDPMWKSFKLWSEIVDPDEFFLVIVHVLVDVALWQLLSKMVNFDCLNCCLCCSAFSLWCFFFFFLVLGFLLILLSSVCVHLNFLLLLLLSCLDWRTPIYCSPGATSYCSEVKRC